MDYWSALRTLGLDVNDELTRDSVRRRYLRQLRAHPPERDPDGFRRLREAYELVRERVPEAVEDDDARDESGPIEAAPFEATIADAYSAPVEPPPAPVWQAEDPLAPMEPAAPHAATEIPPGLRELMRRLEIAPPRPPKPETPAVVETPVPPRDKPLRPAPLPRIVDAAPPTPPLPVSEMIPKILEMLARGEAAEAVVLEKRWREQGQGDDVRQVTAYFAARWALVRELLGVAAELPEDVVRPLALALSEEDLAQARPALEAYRRSHKKAAGEAHNVLLHHAPQIFKQIDRTLWVPEPVRIPDIKIPQVPKIPYHEPPPKRGGSGAAFGGIGIIMVALIVCRGMVGTTTRSYDPPRLPDFKIPDLKLTAPLPDLHLLDVPRQNAPHPQPPSPTATRDELVLDIAMSATILSIYDIASTEQHEAAATLALAAEHDDCPEMRRWLDKLDDARPSAVETQRSHAQEHVDAIHARIDTVCPDKLPKAPRKDDKRKPPKQPKRSSTSVEIGGGRGPVRPAVVPAPPSEAVPAPPTPREAPSEAAP